jgi:hypothetical protein
VALLGTTTTTTVSGTTTTSTTLCAAVPTPGCRKPTLSGRSRLRLRRTARPTKNRLFWVWGKGAATAEDDFGDPPGGATAFALCAYDAMGLRLAAAMPGGGTCGRKQCWKTTRSGFVYRDKRLASDGIRLLRLQAGGEGDARIVMVGRGATLPLPQLPLETPLSTQLVRSDGAACWDATFSAPRRNTATRFKATSD